MKKKYVCGRLLAGILVLALATSSMPVMGTVHAEEIITYADGTYTGTAAGRNGDVSLSVTLKDGRVEHVEESTQRETSWAWNKAKAVIDSINEKKPGLAEIDEIDGVSGATISSNAIKNAAKDAFAQAEKHEEKQPEEPETPTEPENPETPDNPEEPTNPEDPKEPENPETPEKPEEPEVVDINGAGTWDDPYRIGNTKQLQQFAKNVDEGNSYAGEYVALTADIDLSEVENFNSIGTEDGFNIFAGTFDGKEHSILNMTIKAESVSDEGLFTALKANAVVKNLKITNATVEAKPDFSLNAGILAGDVKKAAGINNCHVSGVIKVSSDSNPITVGGIVGNMGLKSELANCSSRVDITVNSVEGVTVDAGDIAGLTKMNAKILNSSAQGSISAGDNSKVNAGGIVGTAMGIVKNVVSSVSVNSSGVAASVIGNLDSFGKAEDLYSNGPQLKAVGNTEDVAETEISVEKLNQNISKLHQSYPSVDFYRWEEVAGTFATGEAQWYETAVDTSIFEGGSGTAEDPYRISTKEQLVAFAKSLDTEILYDGKYVSLTEDIDISDIANWEPIGGSQFAFNGTFDGNGHTIKGLREGTQENPRMLSKNLDDFSNALGLFGTLGVNAVIKNINLTDVAMYAYRDDASFVGGIVGYMQGYSDGGSFKGAVIDNCFVQGTIVSTTHEKNAYVGGIAARQYKGAIINCHTDVDLKSTVEYGESIASVGGITGMTNRGLVANCYSTGKYFGSMVRDIENEIEGMSAVGTLVGVDAGDMVNCYGGGDVISEHYSIYTGAITGWVTGIGKAYQSYFDIDKAMTIAGRQESEAQAYGTKTVGGINEEGEAYEGGVVDMLESYNSDSYKGLADKLNGNFEKFGVNINKYGLNADSLKKWEYKNGVVTFSDEFANANYVQPEAEKVPVVEIVMKDGVWYGRDNGANVTVKIEVKDNEIISEEILTGSKEDAENYAKALSRAKDKAIYGDTTGYGRADVSKFAGGKGTKNSPYLVATEDQLRYIAEAINADETWDNVYFKQTKDIALSDKDWMPIGFAIKAKIKGDPILYSAYPFRGHFDGGNHTITGMHIGSKLNPASMYTAAMFGFIGGDYETNLTYGDDVLKAELSNIHLRDIYINNEVPFDTYAAGLVGTGQNGVFIDNCSVTGKISVKADDIACRGAGLCASMLRGEVTNSWTDVDISAITEEGDVYAGGMFSVTNRINVLNCYALGDLYGTANTNNKVHIGGFTGMAGGFQYNCYAKGNVTSNRPTVDIGIMDGRIANIAYDRNCYFNTDAKMVENGVKIDAVYTGADGTGSSKDVTFGKTEKELASADFAKLLNSNVKKVATELVAADEELGGIMSIYYTRGVAGLKNWSAKDGVVSLANKASAGESTYSGESQSSDDNSSNTSNASQGVSGALAKSNTADASKTAEVKQAELAKVGAITSNSKVEAKGVKKKAVSSNQPVVKSADNSSEDAVAEPVTEDKKVEDSQSEDEVSTEMEEDSSEKVIEDEEVALAAEASKNDSNAFIWIIAILIVLAIAAAGFFTYRKINTKN